MELLEFINQKEEEMLLLYENEVLDDAYIEKTFQEIAVKVKELVDKYNAVQEARTLRFKLPKSWGPDDDHKD